jgi:hypothetical protein
MSRLLLTRRGSGAVAPPSGIETLASIRWTNGTGNAVSAWTDGVTARNYYCDASTVDPQVYAAGDEGWTGPGNVVSFRNTTAGCGGILLDRVFPIPTAGDRWVWRYHYKQDSDQIYAHQHGLGDLSPSGLIDQVFHQIEHASSGNWNHALGATPSQFGFFTMTTPGGSTRRVFSANTWYRFEYLMEWTSTSGARNTWRYRMYPRIYDMDGTLLADERHLRSDSFLEEWSAETNLHLDTFYGLGGSFRVRSSLDTTTESIRNYYFGVNQSKATSTGRVFYAAVDVGLAAGPDDYYGAP